MCYYFLVIKKYTIYLHIKVIYTLLKSIKLLTRLFMNNKTSLSVYAASHLVVEFACFFIILGRFTTQIKDPASIAIGYLLFNILAFGLQIFIGYFVDTHAVEQSKVAIVGCLLVLVGVLSIFSPWLTLILCGLGNALFHLGGGINSLVYSEGKMARGGIFVSSGTIGVGLGNITAMYDAPFWISIILLLVCICAIRYHCNKEKEHVVPNFDKLNVTKPIATNANVIISLCFIAIIVRSYVGFEIQMPWKTTAFLIMLPNICTFIGKFSGGILADYFGGRNVGVLSLLLSIPFLCFFYNNIILCSIGIILFNITMSITLWGIAFQLKKYPGFAFGLTTLAMLFGNVPIFIFRLPENLIMIVLPLFLIVSSICVFISIGNKKRRNYDVKSFNKLSQ